MDFYSPSVAASLLSVLCIEKIHGTSWNEADTEE